MTHEEKMRFLETEFDLMAKNMRARETAGGTAGAGQNKKAGQRQGVGTAIGAAASTRRFWKEVHVFELPSRA